MSAAWVGVAMMTRNAGVARNFMGPPSAPYPQQKKGSRIVSELGSQDWSGCLTQMGGMPSDAPCSERRSDARAQARKPDGAGRAREFCYFTPRAGLGFYQQQRSNLRTLGASAGAKRRSSS